MIDLKVPGDVDVAARLRAKVAADLQETKNLRLLGAVIAGPAMVYAGLERPLPKPLKALMIAVGVGIVASNVEKLRRDG